MSNEPETTDRRWSLLRDVLVFQLKLAVDAARDVLLVPISLGAALLDLVTGTERPSLYFRQVLTAGQQTEEWINLFGGAEPTEHREGARIDRVVERMEAMLVDQYERGGITAQAKDAIDRSLETLTARSGGAPADSTGSRATGVKNRLAP